jgi:membrane protease YdiL (CAAX protease family)
MQLNTSSAQQPSQPSQPGQPSKPILRRLINTLAALLIGFFVAEIGISLWTVNFTLLSPPLAAAAMLVVLFVYYQYFNGNWFSKGRQWRRERFRSLRLAPDSWKSALLAAAMIVIVLETGLALMFRIIPFPEAAFKTQYRMLDSMPSVYAWIIIVMSSVVAGVCEETGFRGYMQGPMERQWGGLTGIILSSAVFVAVHLSKAWASSIIPLIFLASFMLGMLARRTGSILPGIIAHATFDVFNFSYWWSDVAGNYHHPTIFRSGIDWHFIGISLAFTGSLISFFLVLKKLNKKRRPDLRPPLNDI